MEKLTESDLQQQLIALAELFFNGPVLSIEPLKGDGSDRSIFRIQSGNKSGTSVVGVVFDAVSENRDFFQVTRAFQEAGLSVPEIYDVSADERAYLLQDLGPHTLAEKIVCWNRIRQDETILAAYRRVLDCLVAIQRDLPLILGEFLTDRRMDLDLFQADLDYFKKDFIDRFEFEGLLTRAAKGEFQSILKDYLAISPIDCFVYRDFQARNIMWQGDEPWFIDYQSAFLGPRYYDLASLLYGSKSGLDEKKRGQLLQYYYSIITPEFESSYEIFHTFFILFVVLRRIRSLGSYGYLAGVKGKTGFFKSIAPTLRELNGLFNMHPCLEQFSGVKETLERLEEAWTRNKKRLWSRLMKYSEMDILP